METFQLFKAGLPTHPYLDNKTAEPSFKFRSASRLVKWSIGQTVQMVEVVEAVEIANSSAVSSKRYAMLSVIRYTLYAKEQL